MKQFVKGLGILTIILIAFSIFTILVAATDLYLSMLIIDLLYSWGLITAFGHQIFNITLSLLLILPSYFFWLCAIAFSYSFACEKFNVPLKYSIP